MPKHGAIVLPDGNVQFSLWAPSQRSVSAVLSGSRVVPMNPLTSGWFTTKIPCEVGTEYVFRLTDGKEVPDPASRQQKSGVHGPSIVVDPNRYEWADSSWRGRPWREAVIYELHVGLLGGFREAQKALPGLQALGITAIELMPVNSYPGDRNWGYDGVLPFAPQGSYGTPDDLRALVDVAHSLGIMVFLDVVYNHFGPDGNYLGLYAPEFFREDITTPWGPAIDFARQEVRTFFTDNVMMWLTDYHLDGLRFDAVHAITEQDWIDEMASEVRSSFPPDRAVHLVLEHHNAASHLERNVDAQWNDDFHNVMHVILTGETAGYYADYSSSPLEMLVRCLTEGWAYQGEFSQFLGTQRGTSSALLPPTSHVMFLQNHDQIGNRAFGERLTALADPALLEAAIAMQMLGPQIPMLFMGEEVASKTPFLFFTDHTDALAEAVREGRRAEFSGFAEFASPDSRNRIPDPNAKTTFGNSIPKMDSAEGTGRRELYLKLISIRRQEIVSRLDGTRAVTGEVIGPNAVFAAWRLGDGSVLTLMCNFGSAAVRAPEVRGRILFSSKDLQGDLLPAFCTVAWLDDAA